MKFSQIDGVWKSMGPMKLIEPVFMVPLNIAAKEGVVAFSMVSKPQLDTGKELITASLDSLHVELYVSTK